MLKVLIVSVGKLSGGVESYTLILGKLLEQRGIEVHYALREGSWLSEKIISDKKLVLDMGKMHIFSMMKKLKKYAIENEINIIHCNSNNGLFICKNIKETESRKKIGVIHGDVLVDQLHKGRLVSWGYKKLETWLIKARCSYCIAVSKSIKDLLIVRGVNENKIKVIYTGIELMPYDGMPGYYENPLRICTVGNLFPAKNQIILLEALNYIKTYYSDIEFRCDIYGEGIEREKLEKYIIDHELKEVTLKGYDMEVRNKLNHYSLYIHPSKYESFGIAILEAMNAGCCVIANAVGGMLEILNNECGYLVDANNVEKLADAIVKCYKGREAMQAKAAIGKKYAEEKFSVNAMLQDTLALYEKCVG